MVYIYFVDRSTYFNLTAPIRLLFCEFLYYRRCFGPLLYNKCFDEFQEKYWIKDYPFDANNFKKIAKIGCYRIEAFLLNDGIAKSGIFIYGCVTAAQ